MVISYDAVSVIPVRPSFCRCGKKHFHIHSYYRRIIAQVLIQRFICLACKKTISMIPNHCVPYKHHPVSVINPAMDRVILNKSCSKSDEAEIRSGIHRSTPLRWYREFSQFCSVLATEGAKRLGIASISGTDSTIYQKIKAHFSKSSTNFFTALQVALCSRPPPIGIFRSFSF